MLKDSYYMLLSSLLRLATQVLLFVVLARFWGVEQFGVFMYPFTIASLLAIAVDYGFTLQLVRDASKNPERINEVVSRAFRAKLALSALAIVVALVIASFVHTSAEFPILLLMLLLAAIANSFGMLFNLPFRALGRFDEETRVVLWANTAQFVVVGALACLRCGPVAVSAGFLATRAYYVLTSYSSYRRVTGCRRFDLVDREALTNTLRTGLPFAVHVALGTLYFQIDTLLIAHFMGTTGVGAYQAGLRVIMGGLVLTDVLGNVYLPRLAQVSDSQSGLVRTATRMTRHLLVPGALGFTVIVAFAQPIIRTVYGPAFDQVGRLLPLMGVVFFLRYFGTSYGTILTVADRQTIRAIGVSIAVVLSVALNVLFIPRFGLPGAVHASILTHIFLDGVYMVFAWRQTRSLLMDRTSVMIGLTAVAGNGYLLLVSGQAVWVRSAVGLFCLCLIALFALEKLERQNLLTSLRAMVARTGPVTVACNNSEKTVE